jgi:hypothetical protein
MSEWLQLDARQLSKEVTKTIRGVTVKLALSPYDVPNSVRGFRDDNSPFFVIEFKYVTDEPLRVVNPGEPVQLELGVNSGRIYKIKVDVIKLHCQAVSLQIEDAEKGILGAIRDLSSRSPNRLQDRYRLTEDILQSKRCELFSPLGRSQRPQPPGHTLAPS